MELWIWEGYGARGGEQGGAAAPLADSRPSQQSVLQGCSSLSAAIVVGNRAVDLWANKGEAGAGGLG